MSKMWGGSVKASTKKVKKDKQHKSKSDNYFDKFKGGR